MIRVGVAPINIELLCYSSAKTPIGERTCFICTDKVESEVHVLTQCLLYDDIREGWFHHLRNHVILFDMLDVEKTWFIVSNTLHFKTDHICCLPS